MKKNSSIYVPTRQSAVYTVFEIFRLIRVFATAFIIPIISLFRSKTNEFAVFYILLGICLLLLFIVIYSIVKYLRNTYYLSKDNEIIVEEGVFSRSKISIPFDRIQSVDFEQNLIHQIFGVVKLKIDTAGSNNEEASLKAIDLEKAKLIKSAILSYSGESHTANDEKETQFIEKAKTIFSLDAVSLIKVGLTKNVFSSLALMLAVGYQIIDNLNQVGFKEDVKNYIDEATNQIAKTDTVLVVVILAILVFISFIFNLVRAVITHFRLRLEKQNDSFVLSQGLFNRKISTAKLSKIQTLSWNNNLFEGFLKMNELIFKHASANQVTTKNSMIVPGVNISHIQAVILILFGDQFSIPTEYTGVSKKLFYRFLLFASIPLFIYLGLVYWEVLYYTHLSFFIFTVCAIALQHYQKKISYAIDNNFLHIKGGIFGQSHVILPLHMINNVTIKSTPYLRRNDLATLIVHHGAGHESIPYLEVDVASKLGDYILYKVEISRKSWM